MSDMITIFNQLTSSKLADYNLFTEIVDNHFEKFKYLYYMISKLDFKKIDTVVCDLSDTSINVQIIAKENKYINNIIYAINERRDTYYMSGCFTLDVSEIDGDIILTIGTMDESEEGELYGDRFI